MRLMYIALLLLAGSARLSAADLDDLCKKMTEWRAAISSIECEFSCKQEFHQKKVAEPTAYTARWVESPTKIFRRIVQDGATSEYVWEDGHQKALHDAGMKDKESGAIGATSRDSVYASIGSPWTEMYLSRLGRPEPTFPKFFQDGGPALTVARAVQDGRPCIRLSMTHPRSNAPYEWVFDADRGVFLSSSISLTADRKNRIERQADNYFEAAAGIYFPRRITQREFRKGALTESSVTEFTKVVINPPVDTDALKVSFPPNTPVIDAAKKVVYRTDERERPIPSTVESVRMSKDQLDEIEAARPWYRRWPYWVGIAGGVLFLTSAVAYVRRYRRRAA